MSAQTTPSSVAVAEHPVHAAPTASTSSAPSQTTADLPTRTPSPEVEERQSRGMAGFPLFNRSSSKSQSRSRTRGDASVRGDSAVRSESGSRSRAGQLLHRMLNGKNEEPAAIHSRGAAGFGSGL